MAAVDFETWLEHCLKGEFSRAIPPMKRLRESGVQVLYRRGAEPKGGEE
jgi:hypothetical protein